MNPLLSRSPEETEAWGYRLGASLTHPALVTLSGELAAGKTCFAKGVGRGLGIGATIKSPSYNYMYQYEGSLPLYHMDAYNLEDSELFHALGLEEALYEPAVILLEWPSLVADLLPEERLKIVISKGEDENERFIAVEPVGEKYRQILKGWLAYEDFGL